MTVHQWPNPHHPNSTYSITITNQATNQQTEGKSAVVSSIKVFNALTVLPNFEPSYLSSKPVMEWLVLCKYLKKKSWCSTPFWPDWLAELYTSRDTANGQATTFKLVMNKCSRGSWILKIILSRKKRFAW